MKEKIRKMEENNIKLKRCYGYCGELKSLDCFGKNKSKKDGLQDVCKSCRAKFNAEHKNEKSDYNKKYVEKNKNKFNVEIINVMTKICYKCGNEKPADHFARCRKNKDGLQKKCKDCDYKYRCENKTSRKKYDIEYKKINKLQIRSK